MYCPNCATQSTPGQRFCRVCGANLGAIQDAMEDKRGPIDFESLKKDLRELGANLRAGFEGFQQATKKKTRQFSRHDTPAPERVSAPLPPPVPYKPQPLRVKQVRAGSTRRHSFQQGMLSIFSGGAWTAALYFLLNTAAGSGLLVNIELILSQKIDFPQPAGIVPILQLIWLLGLIPVAKGVAHLINGIFFATKPEPEIKEVVLTEGQSINYRIGQPASVVSSFTSAADTDELTEARRRERGAETEAGSPSGIEPPSSVTEDETIRFDAR